MDGPAETDWQTDERKDWQNHYTMYIWGIWHVVTLFWSDFPFFGNLSTMGMDQWRDKWMDRRTDKASYNLSRCLKRGRSFFLPVCIIPSISFPPFASGLVFLACMVMQLQRLLIECLKTVPLTHRNLFRNLFVLFSIGTSLCGNRTFLGNTRYGFRPSSFTFLVACCATLYLGWSVRSSVGNH